LLTFVNHISLHELTIKQIIFLVLVDVKLQCLVCFPWVTTRGSFLHIRYCISHNPCQHSPLVMAFTTGYGTQLFPMTQRFYDLRIPIKTVIGSTHFLCAFPVCGIVTEQLSHVKVQQ